MKEWKIKQELYHRLNPKHDDDLKNVKMEISRNTVADALRYFNESNVGWIYPSKSYVVGICYAWWIAQDFKEDFYDLLNDPNLLYGNDPYFIPYSEDPDTYNKIIEHALPLVENMGMIPDIKKWYSAEFML
tara:strand:- start:530 stop:922 length:393 start_codon:yes stop_codon:yes gene_type:complete